MCGNCGSSDVETCGAVAVCCVCATVVEDVNIVAELTFHESGGGGGVSVGGFIYNAAARPTLPGVYDPQESRLQTLERGKRLISQLATQVSSLPLLLCLCRVCFFHFSSSPPLLSWISTAILSTPPIGYTHWLPITTSFVAGRLRSAAFLSTHRFSFVCGL